jgi:hypothetical protein
MTSTRARTYDEMVDALAAEGLPALQDKLATLAPTDWERPTLLQPPDADKPPWTVLQLAAHFDVFMGLTMGLVAEPTSAQPVVDRASFYISVSDRSKVSPVIYQYIVDHAQGHTSATILDKVDETFKQALEAIRTTPSDTIGPGFFGPMRLDEFVATRLVEVQVHGMDLTDALGRRCCPCRGSRRWRPRCWTRSWPAGPSPAVRRIWRPTTWRSSGPPQDAASTPMPGSRSSGNAERPRAAAVTGRARPHSWRPFGPRRLSRSRLGEATRVNAVSAQCAGVAGWMFLLFRNTFSGSYLAFTSASRR